MYLLYVHTWDKLLLLNNEFTDVKPSKKTCHYDIHCTQFKPLKHVITILLAHTIISLDNKSDQH